MTKEAEDKAKELIEGIADTIPLIFNGGLMERNWKVIKAVALLICDEMLDSQAYWSQYIREDAEFEKEEIDFWKNVKQAIVEYKKNKNNHE